MRIEQTSRILIIVTVIILVSLAAVGAQFIWVISLQSNPDLSKPSGYVGSEQCRICHPREYYAWRTTSHSRTLQDAVQAQAAVIGDFTAKNRPQDFKPKDISCAVGGTSVQQYLKQEGGDLFLLPSEYDVEHSSWRSLAKEQQGKSFFESCAGCHSTAADPKENTFLEPGVGCEACHGPGSNHVIAPLAKKIDTIVNPGRLAPAMAAMVCGSCHGWGEDVDGRHAWPVDYKPGEQLAGKFHSVSRDNRDYFWPSGNAKEPPLQYLDWQLSRHSQQGISCLDCHTAHQKGDKNPHQTRLPGDELCLSCHAQRHSDTPHESGSCVICHMPESTGSLNPGKIKSHVFKPVKPETGKGFGSRFRQPDYCFSCHSSA